MSNPITLDIPQFALPHKTKLYGPKQFADLVRDLASEATNSDMLPTTEPNDLVMVKPGVVGKSPSFRLTEPALAAAAGSLGTGLCRLIRDLTGVDSRKSTGDLGSRGLQAAANVYNVCLGVRFSDASGLAGTNRLVNTKTQTLDAILGRGYAFADNYGLLQDAAATASQFRYEFERGARWGRVLSAVFSGPQVSAGFRPALCLSNSEDGSRGIGLQVGLSALGGFCPVVSYSDQHRGSPRERFRRRLAQTPRPDVRMMAQAVTGLIHSPVPDKKDWGITKAASKAMKHRCSNAADLWKFAMASQDFRDRRALSSFQSLAAGLLPSSLKQQLNGKTE